MRSTLMGVQPPIDFNARRGSAIGRRSAALRERSAAQRRSGVDVRRRAVISRLKARLTLQYAEALCRASDEQRDRWGGRATGARVRRDSVHDELLQRRVRARVRARAGRAVPPPAEAPELWAKS